MRKLSLAALALTAGLFATAPLSAQFFGGAKYRVTVTNITKGQILSPVVVASHLDSAPPFWALGEEASPELAMVAEDAMTTALTDKLGSMASVLDVQTITGAGGPIMPGESASVEVEAIGGFRFVSAVGMLVTTNDAFVGVNGVRGPNLGQAVVMSPAYDAGSEANTEDCAHIPGPPCENVGVRMTEGAEGYVHIHNGIHGIGETLTSDAYDWHNPAARFVIERVQ